MEMETQCCGMLHVFRLNLTPNQPEDNPSILIPPILKILVSPCVITPPRRPSRLPLSGRGRVGTAGNWPDYPINLL